ncbi:hypothetical protein DFP72DRAFT_944051 [Ephemerocybe angulata]|uniref:NACHT domain-containing protein n=1 Tax=Ephemerocybe angulata TaxID=980116 RepID=A0A8H6H6P7_9AGAR|nr:hypothetical protein DFP72DRAFT_944051 [Tulosesus angulatus]
MATTAQGDTDDEGSCDQAPTSPAAHFHSYGQFYSTGTFNNVGRDVIYTTHNPPNNHRQGSSDVDVSAVVVKWLNAPSFLKAYKAAREQHMSGTLNWFLESDVFQQLVKQDSVVVWGTGPPGTGKTVLSAASIKHLEYEFQDHLDVATAYAFLRYSDQRTSRDIFAALLCQMIRARTVALEHVKPLHTRCLQDGDELTETELIVAFREVVKLFRKVLIIIDGLDEVSDSVKEALLRTLPTMDINLLITSRPLDLFTYHTPNALRFQIEALGDDIELFVTHAVQESASLHAITQDDSDLLQLVKDEVKKKSEGMFLVAHLQMEAARNSKEVFSFNTLFGVLENLPSGVNDLYQCALERIDSGGDAHSTLARRVFYWLLHSRPPLPTKMLEYALTFSFDNVQFDARDAVAIPLIKRICGGLVVDEEDSIEFIHYTAQEYLGRIMIDYPGLPPPHTLIAVTCVSLLIGHLEDLQACRSEKELEDFLTSNPALDYPLSCWGEHTRLSQNEGHLHPEIVRFLSQCSTFPVRNPTFPTQILFACGLGLAAAHGLVQAISLRSNGIPVLPAQTSRGKSGAYHFAAIFDQADSLEALLAEGVDGVNERWDGGNTPIHTAITYRAGESTMNQLLLASPLPLSSPDSSSPGSPVDTVAWAHLGNLWGETPLILACRRGKDESIILLLSYKGIDINEKDFEGRSAFFWACRRKKDDLANEIISRFPELDTNTASRDGKTPFLNACAAGHERLVSWFLVKDPLHALERDGNGKSAFLCASFSPRKGCTRVLQCLVDSAHSSRIDINQRNVQFRARTALMGAVLARERGKLPFLLSLTGIDGDAQDEQGRSALMLACRSGNKRSITLLLERGVNVRLRDVKGWSALEWACASPKSSSPYEATDALCSHARWSVEDIYRAVIEAMASEAQIQVVRRLLLEVNVGEEEYLNRKLDRKSGAFVLLKNGLDSDNLEYTEVVLAHFKIAPPPDICSACLSATYHCLHWLP